MAGFGWNNGEPVVEGPWPNKDTGPVVAVAELTSAADEAPIG